jgi:hypothetical protein
MASPNVVSCSKKRALEDSNLPNPKDAKTSHVPVSSPSSVVPKDILASSPFLDETDHPPKKSVEYVEKLVVASLASALREDIWLLSFVMPQEWRKQPNSVVKVPDLYHDTFIRNYLTHRVASLMCHGYKTGSSTGCGTDSSRLATLFMPIAYVRWCDHAAVLLCQSVSLLSNIKARISNYYQLRALISTVPGREKCESEDSLNSLALRIRCSLRRSLHSMLECNSPYVLSTSPVMSIIAKETPPMSLSTLYPFTACPSTPPPRNASDRPYTVWDLKPIASSPVMVKSSHFPVHAPVRLPIPEGGIVGVQVRCQLAPDLPHSLLDTIQTVGNTRWVGRVWRWERIRLLPKECVITRLVPDRPEQRPVASLFFGKHRHFATGLEGLSAFLSLRIPFNLSSPTFACLTEIVEHGKWPAMDNAMGWSDPLSTLLMYLGLQELLRPLYRPEARNGESDPLRWLAVRNRKLLIDRMAPDLVARCVGTLGGKELLTIRSVSRFFKDKVCTPSEAWKGVCINVPFLVPSFTNSQPDRRTRIPIQQLDNQQRAFFNRLLQNRFGSIVLRNGWSSGPGSISTYLAAHLQRVRTLTVNGGTLPSLQHASALTRLTVRSTVLEVDRCCLPPGTPLSELIVTTATCLHPKDDSTKGLSALLDACSRQLKHFVFTLDNRDTGRLLSQVNLMEVDIPALVSLRYIGLSGVSWTEARKWLGQGHMPSLEACSLSMFQMSEPPGDEGHERNSHDSVSSGQVTSPSMWFPAKLRALEIDFDSRFMRMAPDCLDLIRSDGAVSGLRFLLIQNINTARQGTDVQHSYATRYAESIGALLERHRNLELLCVTRSTHNSFSTCSPRGTLLTALLASVKTAGCRNKPCRIVIGLSSKDKATKRMTSAIVELQKLNVFVERAIYYIQDRDMVGPQPSCGVSLEFVSLVRDAQTFIPRFLA